MFLCLEERKKSYRSILIFRHKSEKNVKKIIFESASRHELLIGRSFAKTVWVWNLLQIEISSHLSEKGPNGSFFAPDKLKSHTSKGRNEEEERRRETAMEAFLVFILATLWLWLDRRGLFGGNVFKNPAGYIFIADERPTMYETAQEFSMLISFTHNSWILSNLQSLADSALKSPFFVNRSPPIRYDFRGSLKLFTRVESRKWGKGFHRNVICTFTSLLKETIL